MNKKFLSAVLFGALMVTSTGTFVSCKDYDDDITELRGLIDQQKTDLSSKVTAVETSISSLQTAQTSLQTEIANAKTEAQKAALTAQEAAIATAKAELEDVKSELQAAIAANTEDVDVLKTKIAAIEETMTLSLGRIQALEAFKTTTEAALEALAQADQTLNENISTLDATVIEQGQKIAALEAQIIALETYKGENQTAVDALKDKLADIEAGVLTEDMIKQIAQQVTEIAGSQLSVIEAAISKAVTHVTLYNANYNGTTDYIIAGWDTRMDLRTTLAVENRTFGKDEAEASLYTIANQKEFKQGERAFLTDSVLIRVSPSNAVLTPEQITFVNTELGTLDELVTVEDVKPFKGMITSRGISSNGLWKVYFKLNKEKYSEEAYMAAAKYKYDGSLSETAVKKLHSINYAVAVKDVATETDRYVTSDYGLVLGSDYAPVYNLEFKVNDTKVANIRNRFHQAEDRTYTVDANKDLMYDYAWNVNSDNKIVEKEGSEMHIDANTSNYWEDEIGGKKQKIYYNSGLDQRNHNNFFSAKVGEPFTVSLTYGDEKMSGIYGFYVVYDAYRAVESAPSEIKAWDSFLEGDGISGLNTITTDKKIELTINNKNADGDILGFRVYAVNYDGSLVDPDGKAFYVAVGEIKENVLSTTWTPTYDATKTKINMTSEPVALTEDILKLLADNDYYINTNLTFDVENNPIVKINNRDVQGEFGFELLDKDGEVVMDRNGNYAAGKSAKDAVSIQLVMTETAAKYYKNEGTYSAYFNIMTNKGTIAKKVTLKFTKVMPTFPAIFSAKVNQVIDGVHTTIPAYDNTNWTNAYDMTHAFNGLVDVEGVGANDNNYKFVCENEDIKFNRYAFSLPEPTSEENIAKAYKLIGGTYAVTVSYVYNEISSEYDEYDKYNWSVKAPADKNFKIKLDCAESLDAVWNKFNAKKEAIKFNINYAETDAALDFGAYFDIKKFGKVYNNLGLTGEMVKDLHLVSDGGLTDEYFTVSYDLVMSRLVFTPVVGARVPQKDVNSTLKFTLVDFFGHEKEVSLPYVVVKKP